MALLVDPPSRDSADERPPAGVPSSAAAEEADAVPDSPVITEPLLAPEPARAPRPAEPRLAEPPLTGGRVEALMGRVIRVLSHSPLARPLPAVLLSALGLAGIAFNGLCATAPQPSVATPAGAPAADLGRAGPGSAAPARPGRQRDHVRVDHAVLPRPGHDALGQQPRLVAQPAQGLLDGGRRGRRPGEHHAGRLGRRRVLRRLRADRGARLQPVHVHPDHAARRNAQPVHDDRRRQVAEHPLGVRAGGDLDAPARRLDRRARSRGSPSGC